MAAAWAVALACGAAACALADVAHRMLPASSPFEELAYYPSGNHLRAAVFGQDEAAADLAWLRAVQYYGEHRITDNRFERMEHVFDILTTLAPHFVPAYVFGGFALAQEGRDFPAAERLMLKGIEDNPRSGTLCFELGFLYFVRPGGRDLPKAAQYFEIASHQPDSPPQARRFAAYARQNSGDLVVSYELWLQVYRSTQNRFLRESAARELRRITQAMQTGRDDVARHHLGVPQVLLLPQ
jgi:TPR repeat protein